MVERHRKSGNIAKAFVGGLCLQRGAIASTVSHDAHNIITIGANFADMATAVNHLEKIQGGYVVAIDGEIVFEASLPIGGLMSEEPIEGMARKIDQLEALLAQRLGCPGDADHDAFQRSELVQQRQLRLLRQGVNRLRKTWNCWSRSYKS